ncbi:MAG: hypothetical protein AAGG68_08745 [Bacteroidota bacterium]
MHNLKRFLFLISIGANIYFIAQTRTQKIDQKPSWHPFELNPNLTLKSLVDEGYKFGAMPCGQVQYFKTIGDTTIQYELDIDCHSYNKKFKWLHEMLGMGSRYSDKEISKDDPFYPFDYQHIKNCYQGINLRFFYFKMDEPNREEIVKFTENKNCQIVFENWNEDGSGAIRVYNRKNRLHFHCTITEESFFDGRKEESYWQFFIASEMPFLDTKRMRFEEERKKSRDEYWEW